jgi:ABC-type nitrate/sulfonate/bicarbonate transport system permease component
VAPIGTGGRAGVTQTLTVLKRAGLILGLPAVLVATWWFATEDSTEFYIPPLSHILEIFPKTWTGDRILGDVVPSLARFFVGFLLAVVLGIALGVAIGPSRALRSFFEPVLEFLRAIPPPVLVPILILMAGIGNEQKVLVIVSGAIWPVLLNTIAGVRSVDPVLVDTCRSYRVRGALRLRTFVLRSASPQIMTGVRQAQQIALILMVISELVAATNGLGYSVVQFQRGFQIAEMWSGVIVLGIIGVVLAMLLRLVERRVLVWYHGVRAAERSER